MAESQLTVKDGKLIDLIEEGTMMRANRSAESPATRKTCSEGASPLPVSVQWANTDDEEAGELSALIHNSNPTPIVVTPTVRMQSPRGDVRELSLNMITVPAYESVQLDVPLDQLPIASRGLASGASLAITWDQEEATGSGQFVASRSESAIAYVTANVDGKSAAVRGFADQRRAEVEERKSGVERQLLELTLVEPDGRMRKSSAQELATSTFLEMGQGAEVGK